MDAVTHAQAAEAYRSALKAGRRFVAEQNAEKRSGLLTVLEPLESCGEIPLGTYEIPISKIRGTFAAGRSNALSGNFMPLLGEESEFAAKWRALYASALEQGIVQPIRAYEYLGHYYILEGHKRVSVSKTLSAYSLHADVSRLMPAPGDDTPDAAVFAEILDGDRRKPIGHMWFSAPGRVTELRELAGGDDLQSAFTAFRAAYHKKGFHESIPGITTGDAFWQYAKIFGLPDGQDDPALGKKLSRTRPQWELLARPEPVKTVSGPSEKAKPLFFFQRGALPTVTFAHAETRRFSTAAHEIGRFALQRAFPDLSVSSVDGLRDGIKGDIVFATDRSLAGAALRVALERQNALVLLCHDEPVGVTGTYYAKTEEASFLAGVLAGSLSQSALIGWVCPPSDLGGRGRDLQAFAQGAAGARPAARVFTGGEGENTLKCWAERGVDTVLLPCVPFGGHPALKSFPGVYAHLCSLSRGGAIAEKLAAAAWHWDAFYLSFLRGVVGGPSPPDNIHYRMGLESGVLDVHLTGRASGAGRCLQAFRHALVSGTAAPVEENNLVEIYEV